jgi:hypothetical protein
MIYSDVINNNWHLILPKKDRYTKKDIDAVMTESFLNINLNNGKMFDEKTARWIVVCTAAFYDTSFSRYVDQCIIMKEKEVLKRMGI